MKFIERTTAPEDTNKYYINTSKGGYNKCIIINTKNGLCIPNCTGFAYGRFMEEQGITNCSLPTSNAETWIKNNTKYKTGSIPKLGAVAIWSKGIIGNGKDGAGHDAIVERIYSDGSFLTSNSAYKSTKFYTKKINKYKFMLGYKFQGFIYPDVEFETKSNEDIAKEVIEGKWGNGSERKSNLIKAGYNYQTIQMLVNAMLGTKTTIKTTSKSKSTTSKNYEVYTVKKGDTLSKIAKKYNTAVNKIAKDNGIINKNLIFVGQKIKIYK